MTFPEVTSPQHVDVNDDAIASHAADKNDRWEKLLALLASNKKLTVTQIATDFNISESTVRRDFDELAKHQLARRTHGGIMAVDVAYALPERYGTASAADGDKERIGAKAATLVKVGDVVGFNGGTTVTAAARAVGARPDLVKGTGEQTLTVVSSALNIATEMVLRSHVRTVILGGVAHPQSYELTGPIAMQAAAQLWLDILFTSVIGIDVEAGITCHEVSEAAVSQVLIEHSRKLVVLCTADKFGKRAFAQFASLANITTIITTKDVSDDVLEPYRALGIDVLQV